MSYNERQRSISRVATIFDLASLIPWGQWNAANPQSIHCQPLSARIPLTILCPPPTIGSPPCVNNFGGGCACYTAIKYIMLFLNWVSRSQSCQYILVYNFTNMHATSYRSELFDCSSRVNICEPEFCFTINILFAVSRVRLPSNWILTAMSDS